MAIKTTYEQALKDFRKLLDAAGREGETVLIRRPGAPDVALVAAAELRGLEETVHLLRSSANARRLIDSLESARAGEGTTMTIDELRRLVESSDEILAPSQEND